MSQNILSTLILKKNKEEKDHQMKCQLQTKTVHIEDIVQKNTVHVNRFLDNIPIDLKDIFMHRLSKNALNVPIRKNSTVHTTANLKTESDTLKKGRTFEKKKEKNKIWEGKTKQSTTEKIIEKIRKDVLVTQQIYKLKNRCASAHPAKKQKEELTKNPSESKLKFEESNLLNNKKASFTNQDQPKISSYEYEFFIPPKKQRFIKKTQSFSSHSKQNPPPVTPLKNPPPQSNKVIRVRTTASDDQNYKQYSHTQQTWKKQDNILNNFEESKQKKIENIKIFNFEQLKSNASSKKIKTQNCENVLKKRPSSSYVKQMKRKQEFFKGSKQCIDKVQENIKKQNQFFHLFKRTIQLEKSSHYQCEKMIKRKQKSIEGIKYKKNKLEHERDRVCGWEVQNLDWVNIQSD